MAFRKKRQEDKSRPFTTINLYLPFKVTLCGDEKLKTKWNNFFLSNPISKGDFIKDNFLRDLNQDTDFFNNTEFRLFDKKKVESIMIELGYSNIQTYIDSILDRAIREKIHEK